MQIIALLGGSDGSRASVVDQLMQGQTGQIQHLNISSLAAVPEAGMRALKRLFERPAFFGVITIVTGIANATELAYLRQKNALVCHCHGPLSASYSDDIRIEAGDRQVLPEPLLCCVADHVRIPAEILSEVFINAH